MRWRVVPWVALVCSGWVATKTPKQKPPRGHWARLDTLNSREGCSHSWDRDTKDLLHPVEHGKAFFGVYLAPFAANWIVMSYKGHENWASHATYHVCLFWSLGCEQIISFYGTQVTLIPSYWILTIWILCWIDVNHNHLAVPPSPYIIQTMDPSSLLF